MDSIFAIRKAKIEDAADIARVNQLSWLDAYRGMLPDSEIDSLNIYSLTDQWIQNLTLGDLRSDTIVVTEGEAVIAYSRFYPSVDIDDDMTRVATIGSIYVDPRYQRRGVGRGLMAAIIEAAKRHNYAEITLHVLSANKSARIFYEALNWQKDQTANIEGTADEAFLKVRYRMILNNGSGILTE